MALHLSTMDDMKQENYAEELFIEEPAITLPEFYKALDILARIRNHLVIMGEPREKLDVMDQAMSVIRQELVLGIHDTNGNKVQ